MIKSVSGLKGVSKVRSMHTTGKRTIPRGDGSEYLNLYMLRKERDRMEQELRQIEKRREAIQRRIGEINGEMERSERKESERRKASPAPEGRRLLEDIKVIRLNY